MKDLKGNKKEESSEEIASSGGEEVYHLNNLSQLWVLITIVIHIIQWGLLLGVGYIALPVIVTIVLSLSVVGVVVLLLLCRWFTIKAKSYRSSKGSRPEDEADTIPDKAIYLLMAAAIWEGCMFALYTAVVAGFGESLFQSTGIYTRSTMLQTLRFTSITFMAFHRCLRPANRCDPMRTILELEVVSVCWDALDGSTLYQLLDDRSQVLSFDLAVVVRVLMGFWYLSIGVRIAIMFATHLSVDSRGYKAVLSPPFTLSQHPTVDRTLQAMRLRSQVILLMVAAELFAAGVRITIWKAGNLDALQQEMTIKNLLFIMSVYGAFDMRASTNLRHWNSRDLGFGLKIPTRQFQLEFFRYAFVVTYLVLGALMSTILTYVAPGTNKWVGNVGSDVFLCLIFLAYCRHTHVQEDTADPRFFFLPARSFVTFPSYWGIFMSTAMSVNLFAVRVPAMYYHFNSMASPTSVALYTYQNATLLVTLCVVPVALGGLFWANAYLLFNFTLTACPGNYNAIHDPVIGMVITSTMVEGSMDILSASTLMELASNNLPSSVNGAVIIFALLECFNGCQCFSLQAILSGGMHDSPRDLVKWKAVLRGIRGIIDFCVFFLRMVLWIQYSAVNSVFLIKNIYNLLHTMAEMERYYGSRFYPENTLFLTNVLPTDWYNMTKEEWRVATSETIAAQARKGRSV